MIARFIGYAIVGALGAFLHYMTTIAGVEWLDWNVLVASTVGFVVALCVQYVLNRRFVFRFASDVVSSFARYAATSIAGLLLNLSVLYVATSVLRWHYLIGAALAIVVVTPVNFAINRVWTFRPGA